MRRIWLSFKLPEKRKAEYIQKVKDLLLPFPIEDRDEDFYERKALEIYLIENIM